MAGFAPEVLEALSKLKAGGGSGGIGGDVYYVDGLAGLDTNPGTRDLPFQTITYALTQCVADHDDYIIVLDCWQQEPAWPVVVNISRVHIIGLDVKNGKYPRMTPPGNTAVFQLGAAGYFELAGFGLGSGAAHAAIEWAAGVNEGRGIIHAMWLGWVAAGQDGILIPATSDAPEIEISDCFFGTALTRDGIRIEGNATRGVFQKNLFREVGGVGLNALKDGSDLGAILENRFKVAKGAAQGSAISLALGVGNAVVIDNKAAEDAENPGNNPYQDFSTGAVGTTLNAWGANYSGNVLVYPAVV